jgi:hypothetical protein
MEEVGSRILVRRVGWSRTEVRRRVVVGSERVKNGYGIRAYAGSGQCIFV